MSCVFLDSAFSLVATNLVFQNSKTVDSDVFAWFFSVSVEKQTLGAAYSAIFALYFKNQFLNVNEFSFFTFSSLLISALIFILSSFCPRVFVFFYCLLRVDVLTSSFLLYFCLPTIRLYVYAFFDLKKNVIVVFS